MPVKIIELEAENIKRVKAVQIVPALNGLTIIGGDNNQGKTSVLDAIAWALGGDKYRPEAAQREGANTPPRLHVNLSNGLVVERRGKNSALTVSDPSGRKGGQQLLNEFVEQLALDLPRFMNMNDREKADTLLKIIGVGDRLAAFDREIRALYDRRTPLGRSQNRKNILPRSRWNTTMLRMSRSVYISLCGIGHRALAYSAKSVRANTVNGE